MTKGRKVPPVQAYERRQVAEEDWLQDIPEEFRNRLVELAKTYYAKQGRGALCIATNLDEDMPPIEQPEYLSITTIRQIHGAVQMNEGHREQIHAVQTYDPTTQAVVWLVDMAPSLPAVQMHWHCFTQSTPAV